jgi:hypothetical protein
VTESSAVIVWASNLLKATIAVTSLVSTRIYESLAPQNAPDPYIILMQNAYNEFGTGADGNLGAARMLLTVKAVTKGNGYGRAEAILKAAHDVLQGATASNVEDCEIQYCCRQQIVRYLETPPGTGVTFAHLGGIYKVIVKSAV